MHHWQFDLQQHAVHSAHLCHNVNCLAYSDRDRQQVHVLVHCHQHAGLHGGRQKVQDVVILAASNGGLQV